ncbi:bacteriocin fulvocin C-related protein [Kordia sp.]|uniref:bacteriocin fulvocin C-related protein n=1 Tax=Kordia sp. TaxID=1965332 RepID=UPI003B5C9C5A
MKKLIVYFVGIFFLVSCSQEETCYSCDDQVDAYVKEHLKSIQQMNRADIIKYPNEMQRAMYRTLSAERKKEIWQDKFLQLNSLDLSEGERELMNKFQEFVNKANFEINLTDKERTYLERLREEAYAKYGWTQRFVVSAFGYLEDVDRNGIIEKRDLEGVPELTDPDPDEKPKCDCDWGFGCLDGPCDGRDGACEKTKRDCGWFWSNPCVSLCRPDLG